MAEQLLAVRPGSPAIIGGLAPAGAEDIQELLWSRCPPRRGHSRTLGGEEVSVESKGDVVVTGKMIYLN